MISSPGAASRAVHVVTNARENAPGSSIVTSLRSVPSLTRVQRSMVCSCSVCGVPCRSNQNLSLNPTVSMTRVSLLSNHPIECPNQVGSSSGGCFRPSMKIWRKLWMFPSWTMNMWVGALCV